MTDEEALWMAVGAAPDDQLPRLVLADWLEENDGTVTSRGCYVSNGRADMAAALRATCTRVPFFLVEEGVWCWWFSDKGKMKSTAADELFRLPPEMQVHMTGRIDSSWASMVDYRTALDAIRDLCRAWIAVNRVEVSS